MSKIILKHQIKIDKFTDAVSAMFDVPPSDESITIVDNNIQYPENWNIGVIYGPSGSGKSTLLKSIGDIFSFNWDGEKSVISNFPNKDESEVFQAFASSGFNSIPSWLRPYHLLSQGEQFRSDLAASFLSDKELVIIDEYTSKVDRNVAKAASNALQKYIRNKNSKIILASCHEDIIEWLQPDWVYNPTEALTHVFPRGSLQRPKISLKIFRAKYEAWELFKNSHYLNNTLNKAAKCFLITWNDYPVAFTAILAFPHAKIKNAWRETRTVVLPDYQGLGIGTRISDYIGSLIKAGGGKYYSRTVHPAMVNYRIKHNGLWRLGFKGKKSKSSEYMREQRSWHHDVRDCYSFEYIGPSSTTEESKLFWDNSKYEGQIELF